MAVYVAFLEHEPGRSYGVFFPDFPGCVTGGETMEEALRRAPEALRFHVEAMLADSEPLPVPTPLDAASADPMHKGLIPFIVDVPAEKPRAVRLNITLEERLVAQIDAYAASKGKTRSAFLADAARQALRD